MFYLYESPEHESHPKYGEWELLGQFESYAEAQDHALKSAVGCGEWSYKYKIKDHLIEQDVNKYVAGWDKELAINLRQQNLTQEQIGFVIGIVAEERMNADRIGYIRGYNLGYEDCKKKLDCI